MNVHNVVFFSIYCVIHTLLISCSPVYTPLILYHFSFDACSSHLILSLLSSSALLLLHLVKSVLISYVFLTSNLLFCHLYFSAIFSSHPPSAHFIISHFICALVLLSCLYTHISCLIITLFFASHILFLSNVLFIASLFFWVVTVYCPVSGYHCFGRCTASVVCVEVLNVKQEILVRTYYSCCPLILLSQQPDRKKLLKINNFTVSVEYCHT